MCKHSAGRLNEAIKKPPEQMPTRPTRDLSALETKTPKPQNLITYTSNAASSSRQCAVSGPLGEANKPENDT